MLTAGIILAIMVIPFIPSVMRDVFEIVPPVLKESAYGLGCTTWEVVRNVVLPYTKVGVIGGIMLGLGRALGETMAVTFVIGNAHRLSRVAVRRRATSSPRRSPTSSPRRSATCTPSVADRARARSCSSSRSSCSRCRKLLLLQLAKGEGKRT